MYYIEIKMPRYAGHIYLGWITKDQIHMVYSLDEVGIFDKDDLPRIYKRFGRQNIIRHRVVEKGATI